MKRRDKFDGIIIETTGLANPAPVAQTFFVDDNVQAPSTRLDAIVTRGRCQAPARPAWPTAHEGCRPDRLRRRHRAEQGPIWSAPEELDAGGSHHPRHQTASPSSTAPNAPAVDDRGRCWTAAAFDLQRILSEVHPDFLDGDDRPRTQRGCLQRCRFEVEKPIDRGKIQRLDRPFSCRSKGARPAAHQGHPALCQRGSPLRLPGGAHDRRWRFHRAHGQGRRAQADSAASSSLAAT